ncbi:hypothetical protein C404_07210 [Ralstonia sp. AU12-08]|nr:hypothetical protein C404_07210 [Ralstonia sp. AU12-08]
MAWWRRYLGLAMRNFTNVASMHRHKERSFS